MLVLVGRTDLPGRSGTGPGWLAGGRGGGAPRHGRGGEVVGRLSHPAPLGPRARRPLRQHGGENKALGRPASAGAGV
ncbi:hypothetical protein CapIbe_006309 [Capra ibex]